MPHTTIALHAPEIDGRTVTFRWTVDPPSDIYRRTSFHLTFPETIDISRVPEGLWWTVFILCLHSHWVVLRPCTIRIPVAIPDHEIAFWGRLLATHGATVEAQRRGEDDGPPIAFVVGDQAIDPIPRLAPDGGTAAAFSGGKDSLVQAAMLFELGAAPILVATTSPMPGLED
ncbi:MAG: hypothetical protein R3246_12790, partial [Acidimicrobiia bacterium]|nr:hypothetical protein [Acidimicrobiia bacterium]